jgi:two-component system CheB/CheR fusion protein
MSELPNNHSVKERSSDLFPVVGVGASAGGLDPLRIWIVGCSTGEEPYSMAICLNEYLGDKIGNYKIQIFATDISERSLAKARSGIYSKRDIGGLSADLLNKYFVRIVDDRGKAHNSI